MIMKLSLYFMIFFAYYGICKLLTIDYIYLLNLDPYSYEKYYTIGQLVKIMKNITLLSFTNSLFHNKTNQFHMP
jgi:hypothetical protein